MNISEQYMHRCIQLAKQGAGIVAPNPMVGAVLVYHNRIIGESYHQKYGEAHAEVNCINSVSEKDRPFISSAELYVSFEPCAHHGKTPPCADLIIAHKIPTVIIGCVDPFKQVAGKGIERLKAAGVEVITGVLQKKCESLNKRFFAFHLEKRPYVILKWAQSINGKIAPLHQQAGERIYISNQFTNRLVHKWRSEEAAILVGTNTAAFDDPELTNRWWSGKSPVRLIVDMNLRLPLSLEVFDGHQPTIIFNTQQHNMENFLSSSSQPGVGLSFYQLAKNDNLIKKILEACYQNNIQSIIVEGGARLLQSFIDEGVWDEARIITNQTLYIQKGLPAPELKNFTWQYKEDISTDKIDHYTNNSFPF
jgi:diaminohydroxyphosphoribosylaminopyrimidine deaminase/5-amino-6-(5-phosphoribosylamino)uracil reductase